MARGDAGRGRTSSKRASHAALLLLLFTASPSDCGSGAGLRRCGVSACAEGGRRRETPPVLSTPALPGATSRTTRSRGAAWRSSKPGDPPRAPAGASVAGCDHPGVCLGRGSVWLAPQARPPPLSPSSASRASGEGDLSVGRAGALANWNGWWDEAGGALPVTATVLSLSTLPLPLTSPPTPLLPASTWGEEGRPGALVAAWAVEAYVPELGGAGRRIVGSGDLLRRLGGTPSAMLRRHRDAAKPGAMVTWPSLQGSSASPPSRLESRPRSSFRPWCL